jgi:hypothetical protein
MLKQDGTSTGAEDIMFRSSSLAAIACLCWTANASGEVRQVVFDGAVAEHKWTLKELNPELPSDWSGYNYLVLEIKASSPQRFNLTLYSPGLAQSRRMQPLANAWLRAAVPLTYYRQPNRQGFDLASVGKVARNSFWISTGGVYGPLDAVEAIGVSMEYPLGKPTLEIRSVSLSKDDPGSDVLEPKPLVDEFGQWIPVEWPGKIKSLGQLKKEWAAEESALGPGTFNYCRYGGYLNTHAKATGFFRVEQIEGKWWFVDPDGHLFFSTSSNGMAVAGEARVEGRESYYAVLPPASVTPSSTERPTQRGFYAWNELRRFGPDWNTKWIGLAIRRLEDWGINTIGNWSDSRLWDSHKKAYFAFLRGWGMETGYLGMPDVYAPDWPAMVDRAAAGQCAPRQDDPYLLGYFIGNEPPWPGRESLLVDAILQRPASAIGREAQAFLAQGDTPERRREFVYRAFARYLEVINAAIRRHDPHHLNLGLRFGGGEVPPEAVVRSSRSFDVYSMNVYNTAPDSKVLAKVYEIAGRPILIGEFHFGVPGRGLAAGLVQTRDQQDRGVAYRYFVEQAAAFPALIGTSWFQWVDQPSLGRMDGENYNIGLVDVTDRPYRSLVDAIKATNRRLFEVHSGKLPPFSQMAKTN